jgi:hypothetical protein
MIHSVLHDFVANLLLYRGMKHITKLSGFTLVVEVRLSERGKLTERNVQNDNLTCLLRQ